MIARLLLANVLVLAAGLGLLPLIGAASTRRELLRRAGLAHLAGLALVGILGAVLAILGAAPGWLFLSLVVAGSLGVGAVSLRTSTKPQRRRSREAALLVPLLAAPFAAALLVHAGRAFAVAPLERFDAWFIWGLKGRAIELLGGAPGPVFGNPGVFVPHLEYPLLLPALEALDARAMGAWDVQALHLQFLLVAPSLLAASWSLLADLVPPLLLWPALLAIVAAPAVLGELLTAYADVPLAAFFAVGAAAAGRWLVTEERWPLALAALLLGAAVWTKNEGSLYVAAALVALALAAGRARLRPVLALALGVVLLALPWRIFTAVHGLHAEDYRFSDSFDAGYVADRLGRGPIALRALAESLFSPSVWSLLVPLFLAAAALALLAGRRRLPLFALGSALLGLAGVLGIYVISPLGLPDYLAVTSDRIVAAPVLAGAVLAPLLAADALGYFSSGRSR